MNFLHIMKDLKYVVIVTYDKKLQTCRITAEYNLIDFKVRNLKKSVYDLTENQQFF